MKPIVFPKWPELLMTGLAGFALLMAFWITGTAFQKYAGNYYLEVFPALLMPVVGFSIIAFLLRRHRAKTEAKAAADGETIQELASDG